MSLSDKQWEFLKDVAKLILYAWWLNVKLTGGELWRTSYQQAKYVADGLSKTHDSQHLARLAIDLNFFIDGELVYKHKKIERLGKFWEKLRPENRWGGNFNGFYDGGHFERN